MGVRYSVILLVVIGLLSGCSRFNDSTLGRYYQDCGNFGNYYGEVCDTEAHVEGSYAALERPVERDYSSEVDALQSKISDQESELARLRSELQNTQQQLADKEQALANAQANQSGYDDTDAELARLQQERDELKRQLANLESEKNQLSQQVAEQDATIASLQAGQTGRTVSEEERAQMAKDLAARDAELEKLREQMADQKNELDQLRMQMAALEEEKARLAAALAERESALASLQSQQGMMSQLEGDKTQLAQDIASRDEEIARLQAALRAQEEANGNLTQSVADRDVQLAALQAKHDALAEKLNINIAQMTQVHEDLFQLLKPQIEKGNIKIQQAGDQLTINMADRLLFDSGKAELKQEGAIVLKKVGEILKQASNKRVKVLGHTDNVPIRGRLKKRFPTNLALSEERATNAAHYLLEGGVDSSRMTTEGMGDTKPIASNKLAEGRQKNRRVDILVTN